MMRPIFALGVTAILLSLSIQPSHAQSAQEFNAAEARGEFGGPRAKQSKQRQVRQQRQVHQRQVHQRRAPVAQTSPFAGVALGGSWLANNMGRGRPAGAPGPWCGFAMRKEMVSLGMGDPGPKFNIARSWCSIGSPAPVGAVGSIFVSRGHVSKVVAGNCPPGRVATISGNATGRRVSHMCEPISRAICSRWPGRNVAAK